MKVMLEEAVRVEKELNNVGRKQRIVQTLRKIRVNDSAEKTPTKTIAILTIQQCY